MLGARQLTFLLTLLLIESVAADSGDDFSNNLFSDLAPLLALFGERVTMQFMSQSMGWADNIILAMAPLGIITVIVSAIRVGGPSWLKGIVGRARENLAVAEAELMSSTSEEVCELWNGQGVVRSMGAAMISEFICLLPEGVQSNGDDLKVEVVKNGAGEYLKETKVGFSEDFRRWRASQNPSRSFESTGKEESGDGSQSKIIIIRNPSTNAPNISLNTDNLFGRGELHLVAVIGIVLQLGVLIFSGFVTYYPTLQWQKNGQPIAGYAFPCTAAGTLVLVIGMLICADVVESSTQEKRYPAGQGKEARMVWLQKAQTVSDQSFDSFAIYTKDKRTLITTSHRAHSEFKQLF
ncbi:hypothetical protein F5884DRAFT_855694 [Xylogone sp. PMI_703]|nr:hypothetical protein F5884DRAFT_855694 [Xylogone sp. PMI_703]